jgi:crotonobetainyl-CoA:carnitine CoA-transferase CaiB-like acyl-CoA transferase
LVPLLSGVRILEVTSVVMGPFAGQILADLGADTIKVEPLSGDVARQAQVGAAPDMGAMYVNNNRNKRVISLDLKSIEGKKIMDRLLAWSEVFVHNMRMDAIARLGLNFERVVEVNPQLIYCSALGFGQRGRYRGRPAFDDIIQAASGLAGLSLRSGEEPRFVPTIIADKVGALYAVYGVLAALVWRSRGNRKAIQVEAPMFEALVSFLLNEHLAEATFSEQRDAAGYTRIFDINRRPHRTKDGWIAVLPYTTEQWKRFLLTIGNSDFIAQPWFTDAGERNRRIGTLYSEVAAAMAERTTQEWMHVMLELDIPCSEVKDLDDLLADPHLEDVDFFTPDGDYPPTIRRALPQPIQFGGVESQPDRAARRLGQDSREVLRTCGYREEEIDRLISEGVVRECAPPHPPAQ